MSSLKCNLSSSSDDEATFKKSTVSSVLALLLQSFEDEYEEENVLFRPPNAHSSTRLISSWLHISTQKSSSWVQNPNRTALARREEVFHATSYYAFGWDNPNLVSDSSMGKAACSIHHQHFSSTTSIIDQLVLLSSGTDTRDSPIQRLALGEITERYCCYCSRCQYVPPGIAVDHKLGQFFLFRVWWRRWWTQLVCQLS